jgi:acetoin utilization deacetylase AcuC-like enzyme
MTKGKIQMLKIAWAKEYILPLPANHRFPMSKYELLPQQLLHEGTITDSNLFCPSAIEDKWITLTHAETYWNKLKTLDLSSQEIRRTGFPLSQNLVDREVVIMNGTLLCARYALDYGVAMNIAGGTHHAFINRGEGFCLLNDIAIAANYLLHEKLVSKILVVDLDVHQGNGTAEIFKNEPRVFTFSMHGANNYPLIKEQSDLDIALQDYTNDKVYLTMLDWNLNALLDQVQPGFIFFQSGVDILETDELGKLAISREGCKRRDELVLQLAHKNKIPLVASMGGGYAANFTDIIEAHANTYRLAQYVYF